MAYGFGIRKEHELAKELAQALNRKQAVTKTVLALGDFGGASVKVYNEATLVAIVEINTNFEYSIFAENKKPVVRKKADSVIKWVEKIMEKAGY